MTVTKTPQDVVQGSPVDPLHQPVPLEMRILLDEMRTETGRLWFDTVADLLADTTLTYTSGQADTVVAGNHVHERSGGFAYVVAASGAADHHVTTSGGVKLYVQPNHDGLYSAVALGLTDGADATARLLSLFDGGLTQLRLDGVVKVNGAITPSAVEVIVLGTPGVGYFDMSGGGSVDFDSGHVTLPALSVDIAQGANTVTFAAAHGLVVGDVFSVWNPANFSFALTRPDYRDGNMFRVANVISATSVNVYSTSPDAYAAADMLCFKILGGRVRLSGFDIIPPSSGIPLKVTRHQDVEITDVFCPVGVADTAISVDRCFDLSVDVGSTSHVGNAYPVMIANSQKGHIRGDSLYSTRHCIAIGGGSADGSVPPRDIQIHNAYLTNMDSGIGAADIHGGSDRIEYHDCVMDTSFDMAGRNSAAYNCTIYGRQLADGNCIFGSEVDGGIFRLHNCKLVTSGDGINFGLIDLGTSYLSRNFVLDVRGLTVEHRNPATASSVSVGMLQSAVETNWDAATNAYPVGVYADLAVFIATSAGTVDGTAYNIGDRICYSTRVTGGAWVDLPKDARIDVKIDGLVYVGADVSLIVKWGGLRDISSLASTSIVGLDAPTCALVGASATGNYAMPMRLPQQTASAQVTTVIEGNFNATGALTFKWSYPRRPQGITHWHKDVDGAAAAEDYAAICTFYDLRTVFTQLALKRIDGTLWAAAKTAILTGLVWIDDL